MKLLLHHSIHLIHSNLQAIIIQSQFRRMQAQKLFRQLQSDAEARIKWQRDEELKRQRKKEEEIRRLMDRISNPRTKKDFHLVYAMLESMGKGIRSAKDLEDTVDGG